MVNDIKTVTDNKLFPFEKRDKDDLTNTAIPIPQKRMVTIPAKIGSVRIDRVDGIHPEWAMCT